MASVKGSILVGVVKRAKREPQAMELLGDEDRAFVKSTTIHASQWYPLDVCERLVHAIEKAVVGKNDGSLAWTFGSEMAKVQLTGLYEVFRVTGDPIRQIERVPTLWKAFFDDGTWTVARQGERELQLRLGGGASRTRMLCLAAGGFLEEACRMAGGPAAHLEKTSCRFDGADACSYALSW
jgi:hypothetical protein